MEIGEVAKLMKLKSHTLRYYESVGLIKDIKRDESGKRDYSEADLRWIEFINRLRATGMPISKMEEYARLRYQGDATISQRRSILEEHLSNIEKEMKLLAEAKNYVEKKIEIYNEMEEKINGK